MPDTVELIERSDDLASVEGALEAAGAGEGSLTLVRGPAGIGKTALLGAASELARARGLTLLKATGTELEREFPFGVVRQLYGTAHRESALPPVEDAVSSVFAPAPADRGSDVSFQVLDGLYWLVADMAQETPLLLVLDDAQWSDEPSLRHLIYLCRRFEGLPVALLLAERSGDTVVTPALEDLRELAVRELNPAPLSEDGVAVLVERVLGRSPHGEFASACLHQTGGYPLYLDELLRVASEAGIEPDLESAAELEGIDADGLARHVWRRVESLGDEATAVVGVATVLGELAEPGRIAALAELPLADVAAAIEGLTARGVFEDDELPRFTHPVVRAAVEGRLAAGTLDGWHREAARLLDREGADIRMVAAHLMKCSPRGEAWAVERLREFADSVIDHGAPESAALALRRALAEGPPEAERFSVLCELAHAEDAVDRPAEALRLLNDALRFAPNDEARAEIAIARGQILALTGRYDEAKETLERALATLDDLDPSLVQRIDAELITYGLVSPDARRGAMGRVGSYEGRAPEGIDSMAAHTAMALAAFYNWRPASEVAALAEGALSVGEVGREELTTQAWLIAAWLLIFADGPDRGYAHAERALVAARREGHAAAIGAGQTTLACAAWRRGDIPEAVSRGRTGQAVGGETTRHKPLSSAILAIALLDAGELDAVDAVFTATSPDQWEATANGSFVLLYTRARLRLAQGRLAEVEADLEELRRRSNAFPNLRSPEDQGRILALTLAHRRGQADEARRLAGELIGWARGFGDAGYLGLALRTAAPVGDAKQELEMLREAVEVLEPSPFRLEHARALIALGAALRRRGERAAAREPLAQGLDIAYRCGAGGAVSEALEELRASGARPRRPVRDGPEALTPSEARIALLAAEGRTNREIAQELYVTLKTVEGTLGKAYAKLGISGRGARQVLPEALGPLHEGS